jgi:hypothetical protein
MAEPAISAIIALAKEVHRRAELLKENGRSAAALALTVSLLSASLVDKAPSFLADGPTLVALERSLTRASSLLTRLEADRKGATATTGRARVLPCLSRLALADTVHAALAEVDGEIARLLRDITAAGVVEVNRGVESLTATLAVTSTYVTSNLAADTAEHVKRSLLDVLAGALRGGGASSRLLPTAEVRVNPLVAAAAASRASKLPASWPASVPLRGTEGPGHLWAPNDEVDRCHAYAGSAKARCSKRRGVDASLAADCPVYPYFCGVHGSADPKVSFEGVGAAAATAASSSPAAGAEGTLPPPAPAHEPVSSVAETSVITLTVSWQRRGSAPQSRVAAVLAAGGALPESRRPTSAPTTTWSSSSSFPSPPKEDAPEQCHAIAASTGARCKRVRGKGGAGAGEGEGIPFLCVQHQNKGGGGGKGAAVVGCVSSVSAEKV